ncbi:MAG TPA: pyrroline-5-carboxylate reductase [Spirochaetia bacterium]|nr:pyrroline-5-carboxylate reductase [Spirochaetia bacterium]
MKRVGIIGFGIMGEAFATCLARKIPTASLLVYEQKKERREAAARLTGVTVAASASEVLKGSDITILAIKPQDFVSFASELGGAASGRPLISILAGQTIETVSRLMATDQVARFMPNLAAVKGASVVGVSFHPGAADRTREDALAVASALGTCREIPEKLMSAMTGVSGSGLAFVLQFVHGLAQGGVAAGFDYPSALAIAVGTLEGAASLLKDGTHPLELVSRVTSPAGTTIQGVRALEKAAFTAAVMEAVEAAARKAADFEK